MFVGALLGVVTLLHYSMALALLLPLALLVGGCVGAGISARSRADWTRVRYDVQRCDPGSGIRPGRSDP